MDLFKHSIKLDVNCFNVLYILLHRVCQKTGPFLKVYNFLYNDIGRHSIYQNVQLFIRSKTGIMNAAMFKYSLHKVSETILH